MYQEEKCQNADLFFSTSKNKNKNKIKKLNQKKKKMVSVPLPTKVANARLKNYIGYREPGVINENTRNRSSI